MSWAAVKPEGDPVRGDASQFEDAIGQWHRAREHGQILRDEFRMIVGGNTQVGLEGAAATAFASIVEDAQHVLDDVPEVFASLEMLLSRHLARLRELKAAADAALARAKVAQAERAAAASQQAATNARIATLRRQVDQLRALPPEHTSGQLVVIEHQLASEAATRNHRNRSLDDATRRIQAGHATWQRLRDQEDELNRATAGALMRFDLRSLRDPGNLEKAWDATARFLDEKVLGFGQEFVSNLAGLAGAVLSGDFEQALWHYREYLDHVMTILSVAAVAIAVVAIVIGGIATGGALLLAIGAAVAAVATVKFGTSVVLFADRSANKSTGERLTGTDVVADGLTAAFDLATFGKASALKLTGVNGPVMFRHLVEDQSHIVMKNFGQISLKRTSEKIIVEDVLKDPQMWRAGLEHFVESESVPTDVRHQVVDADIRAMRSGGRGLSAPVRTVILPTF